MEDRRPSVYCGIFHGPDLLNLLRKMLLALASDLERDKGLSSRRVSGELLH